MTRKPFLHVAALLACGALAAGCGGGAKAVTSTTASGAASSASTTTSSSAPTTSSSTTTTAGATTTTTSSASTTTSSVSSASTTTAARTGAPASPSAGLAAAVAVCRREVASAGANALTAAERSQLSEVCTLAGSRNRARLRAAERQVCRTVIRDTAPGLSGAAVAAAEQTCNRL